MLIATGFIFAILFGTRVINIIDPQIGFLFSIGLLFVGIGESANHKKEIVYEKGNEIFYNPLNGEVIGKSPTLHIPKGTAYKRKPIFIGILFDIIGIAFITVALYKLF